MTTSKSRCNEDQVHVPVSDSCSVTFLKDEKMSDNVTLSQGQKFKKMRSLYTEGGMVVFNSRFKELQNLLQQWRNKEDTPMLSKSYHLGDIDSPADVSKLHFQSNLESIPNHGGETNPPSTNHKTALINDHLNLVQSNPNSNSLNNTQSQIQLEDISYDNAETRKTERSRSNSYWSP